MINIFLLILCLTSCLGTKKVIENNKETIKTEKKTTEKDNTSKKKEVFKENIIENAAIQKESSISLKTTDSIVNKRINEALKNFNYSEKSGGNSVNAKYDSELMQLQIKSYIDKTLNKETESYFKEETNQNNTTTSETTFEQNIDSYVYKRIITAPWWLWVIVYFAFLDKKVVSILGNFIPKLKGAKSIFYLLRFLNKK